ncbi:hypothetical protein [Nodularia sphaerocarpa]|uniref:hypothetical protein n=1 Tax=Nodularia sphaerocarpa TaxID=137816 RepID=UPI00232EEFF2|nr:hypothetical protein [Nodularia sphaerocarpa]MDB9372376.1 hypothetical protein [Nodularia sphaerocarpa CS-585]MDB9377992.1 hypothetical protein [Nodularia sphaerocarpa CS-585A2]
MELSSELQSQIFSKYLVAQLLYKLELFAWADNFSRHELTIEAWANGLWIKQAGLVSYKDLAAILREEAENKAQGLTVERLKVGYLVSSMQDANKKYLVQFNKNFGWRCNCMRFKCWHNRMSEELPPLYKALNHKTFCHHIIAAYNSR